MTHITFKYIPVRSFCTLALLWRIFYLSFIILGSSNLQAQVLPLTLDNAIAIGLKNNYSIIISKNRDDIAKNTNTPGNAGMLPQVGLNASYNSAVSNTHQNYSTGAEVNKSGVNSSTIVSGIGLNWTLFDGFNMFATRDKLQQLQDMGDLNVKIAIENTVSQIINAYYDIIRQKQLLKAILYDDSITTARLKIAKLKFDIGSASKLDFLQAKVDLNADKSLEMTQRNVLENSEVTLNQLLAVASDNNFDVTDSIKVSYNPTYEQLKTNVIKQNNSMKLADINKQIAASGLRQIQALRYPVIAFNSNYIFSKSENAAGLVLLNQNLGLNAGFTASFNLFNGFNVNNAYKNAKINMMIADLGFKDTQNTVEANLLKAFKVFQSNLQIVALEEENYVVAKENVDVSLERFRLGSINSIDLIVAQKSYIDAGNRLVSARYNAKISETELMRLNGDIVK